MCTSFYLSVYDFLTNDTYLCHVYTLVPVESLYGLLIKAHLNIFIPKRKIPSSVLASSLVVRWVSQAD